MAKEINNLQVFDRMVQDNNPGIMMSNTIYDAYGVKQGGIVSFGVTPNISDDARIQRDLGLPGKYMIMCFAVDREEFSKTKKRIESETSQSETV